MSRPQPLLTPVSVGPYLLPNRVVMPPLTRNRATEAFVPTARMALYYAQRTGAGMQVAEATAISGQGVPYPRVPGIWNRDHVAAWRRVTEAVHARGGVLFLQLWHGGRVSHSTTQPDGSLPVSASAIAVEGTLMTPTGVQPFETPRALETDEIPHVVEDYAEGARNAMRAGFDGVEVHAANGYLPDQFLNDQTNHRTDAYGGDLVRRLRFLTEVVDAVTGVWGPSRVGIRMSPSGTFMDCRDSDKRATYTAAVRAMSGKGLAYLHLVEPTIAGSMSIEASPEHIPSAYFRDHYDGTIVVSGDHTRDTGNKAIASGTADLVGYGRPFISNPDLPLRFASGAELAPSFRSTYYSGGDRGYVDYPSLLDEQRYHEIRAAVQKGDLDADAVLAALAVQPDHQLIARNLYYTRLQLAGLVNHDLGVASGLSQVS